MKSEQDFELLNGRLLISAEKDKNYSKKIKREDGTEVKLYFDGDIEGDDPDKVCCDGIIVKVPKTLHPQSPPLEVEVGDHVYCLYFMTRNEEEGIKLKGKEVHVMDYHCDFLTYYSTNVFCVVRGKKIKMIADWNFLEEIKEEPKKIGSIHVPEIVHAFKRTKSTKAIARHICKELQDKGVKKGDIVVIRDNMRYRIKVEGNEYFRVSARDILAKIEGGKTIPLD